MSNAEAHLAFLKCWLIISGADTVLFIPKGSRTLHKSRFFNLLIGLRITVISHQIKNIVEKGFFLGWGGRSFLSSEEKLFYRTKNESFLLCLGS